MRRIGLALLLAMAVSGIAALSVAQTAQKPAFEVASNKPNKSGSLSTSNGFRACRYVANNATLKMMITFAYRLPNGQTLPQVPDRIIGGPSWIETDHFDVEAKRGSDADSIQLNEFLLMIQSLLEERFQLRTHWSKQDFPVYELVVAKEGPKLQRSADQTQPPPQARNPLVRCSGTPFAPPPPPAPSTGSRGTTPPKPPITFDSSGVSIDVKGTSLVSLLGVLQIYMDRPIINKTGMTGLYDVKMRFSPERTRTAPVAPVAANAPPPATGQTTPPTAADPSGTSGPSIFTAIQELGLKLESAKGPLDVLVIDSVQRPTENLGMRRTALLLISGLTIIANAVMAAAQTAQKPTFEVASVKPRRPSTDSWSVRCAGEGDQTPAGRCEARNAPLRRIIGYAYGLELYNGNQYLLQGPGWISSERYDIDAKAEQSSTRRDELLLMLQALLADRFKLKISAQERDLPGYALVVAQGGPKLRPLGSKICRPFDVAFCSTNTKLIARELSSRLQAPVVDKTNISGEYNWTIPLEDLDGDHAASIFTLAEERWGLKLESVKVKQRIFGIDHVERPTEN
jgi:uncharacterized protein (TIGR03435 family)